VLDDLGRIRRLLKEYAASVPADPLPEVFAPRRGPGGPVAVLGTPVKLPPLPQGADPEPAADGGPPLWGGRAVAPARLPEFRAAPLRARPARLRRQKKDEGGDDPLRGMLADTAGALIRGGLSDPDVRARREAFGALETLGDLAGPYLVDLVRALRDCD